MLLASVFGPFDHEHLSQLLRLISGLVPSTYSSRFQPFRVLFYAIAVCTYVRMYDNTLLSLPTLSASLFAYSSIRFAFDAFGGRVTSWSFFRKLFFDLSLAVRYIGQKSTFVTCFNFTQPLFKSSCPSLGWGWG